MMKVSELKSELANRGMSPVGRKSDLINRLQEASLSSSPTKKETLPKMSPPETRSPVSRSPPSRSSPRSPSKMVTKVASTAELGVGKTIGFFTMNVFDRTYEAVLSLPWQLVLSISAVVAAVFVAYNFAYRSWMEMVFQNVTWHAYWFVLGVLSSMSLGSSADTFSFYLAPFIARVAHVANACGSTEFDVFGEAALRCPHVVPEGSAPLHVDLATMVTKVYFEVFFWSLGTVVMDLAYYVIGKSAMPSEAPSLVHIQAWAQRRFSSAPRGSLLLLGIFPWLFSELAALGAGFYGVSLGRFFFSTFVGRLAGGLFRAAWIAMVFSPAKLSKAVAWISSFVSPHLALWVQSAAYWYRSRIIHHSAGSSMLSLAWKGVILGTIVFTIYRSVRTGAREYQARYSK